MRLTYKINKIGSIIHIIIGPIYFGYELYTDTLYFGGIAIMLSFSGIMALRRSPWAWIFLAPFAIYIFVFGLAFIIGPIIRPATFEWYFLLVDLVVILEAIYITSFMLEVRQKRVFNN